MMISDTIAAIATAMTNSGIGMIRISGPEAIDVADRVFHPKKEGKTLKEEKLINYEVYGPITLTNIGKNAAEKVLEAYDIVCLFFTEILKMEKAEAEHEANKIKATLKDETINKLAKYTNETLGLPSLECGYNINNERCLKCIRRERKNING